MDIEAISFRTQRYMGLGTWKKKNWYPATIRKQDLEHIWIVYVNPMGHKVYARIPIADIRSNLFEIKYEDLNEVNIKESKIDSIDWIDIWQDYVDHESQKIVISNQLKETK